MTDKLSNLGKTIDISIKDSNGNIVIDILKKKIVGVNSIISMINWNARYDEVIIGDVEEEEKEKRSLTLIGDGVAYCDTLMYGFDKWIIEKMDFTKGVNEKLK